MSAPVDLSGLRVVCTYSAGGGPAKETVFLDDVRALLAAAPVACADPVVETNVALLRSRSAVGVEKYGTTLADSKAPLRDWLEHALLEVLDCANYLQTAMGKIDSAQAPALPTASVDTAEFRNLLQDQRTEPESKAKSDRLIAHAARAVENGVIRGWNDAWGVAQKEIGQLKAQNAGLESMFDVMKDERNALLDAAPQQHAQAALSDEQIDALWAETLTTYPLPQPAYRHLARAILAASHQPAAAAAPQEEVDVKKPTGDLTAMGGMTATTATTAGSPAIKTASPWGDEAQQGAGELPQDGPLNKVIRALEGYADSYDRMSRIGKTGDVDCRSVAYDIRRNMVDAVREAFAQRAASVPAEAVQPWALVDTPDLRQKLTDYFAGNDVSDDEMVTWLTFHFQRIAAPAQVPRTFGAEEKYAHKSSCNLMWASTFNTPDDYCDCGGLAPVAVPVPAASVQAQTLSEFPAALGESPCIEDRDGLPMAMCKVIQSRGSPESLRSLYRLINIWGAEQRATVPQDIGRDAAYTVDQIAEACAEVGIHDSYYESLTIALAATPPANVAQAAPAVLSAAAADVLAERQRQVEAEGMEQRYDDKYKDDELRRAAAVYACPEIVHRFRSIWPWAQSWMKLSNPRRDAVKAAALLIAEIERIDRAAAPQTTEKP